MEKSFLRRIYGPWNNEETKTYEIRSNIEVRELFGIPNIIDEIWYKRLIWLGHIIRAKWITNDVLNKTSRENRPKQRWIDKNKKELRQIARLLEIENFNEVAQDRERCKDNNFVAMCFNVLKLKEEECKIICFNPFRTIV